MNQLKLMGFYLMGLVISANVVADDHEEILAAISHLTQGVDRQDGDLLREAFHADAAIFATNPAGDGLISLPAESFANLHEEKRFGGQARDVEVVSLDITDGLIAQAKVVASNQQLHYTYYLSLVKLAGSWKIQNFLQRSKPM